MLTKLKTILLAAILSFSFQSLAAKSGVKVDVHISPAGSFEITTSKVSGKLKKKGDLLTAKKLSVRVSSFKTGIKLRDNHTKEKLQFKKHPKISVRDVKAKAGKGIATIKILGQKKKIKFIYKDISKKMINAKFKLSLKDFGITGISYMGAGVKDVITISANVKVSN